MPTSTVRTEPHRPVGPGPGELCGGAWEFVKCLRTVEVVPNGRTGCAKRRLMDKGVRYILESCRALFGYASRQRHLSPYAQNPFSAIQGSGGPCGSRRARKNARATC